MLPEATVTIIWKTSICKWGWGVCKRGILKPLKFRKRCDPGVWRAFTHAHDTGQLERSFDCG